MVLRKNLAEFVVNPGVSHESEQDQSDMHMILPVMQVMYKRFTQKLLMNHSSLKM